MKRDVVMHDLSLMLLYLSSWKEGSATDCQRKAWKGFDFDVLDELRDEGYTLSSNRAKSVTLTDKGVAEAEKLLGDYGIEVDPDAQIQRFYRLHLSFNFEELTCMRTLLVPMHTSFEDFHTQIQACLNWLNYHLYDFSFECEGQRYYVSWPDYETGSDPREDLWMPEYASQKWLCSQTTYLDDFLPKVKEMTYSYDYGDGWEIRIRMLNQKESFASDAPFCWDGVGDAPPEDVGGESGFERFLQAIADPYDDEHEDFKAWGESQGFERFSKRSANRRLENWQEYARTDTNTMSREAQLAAFGKVIATPKRRR